MDAKDVVTTTFISKFAHSKAITLTATRLLTHFLFSNLIYEELWIAPALMHVALP
jgi:hypothetical protein